jgi:hypothetical protein
MTGRGFGLCVGRGLSSCRARGFGLVIPLPPRQWAYTNSMSKTVLRGIFYWFDKSQMHREIGAPLGEPQARMRVENGGDVYTLYKEDAYRLAMAAYSGRAQLAVPTKEAYFSHYHPGGVHPKYEAGHLKGKKTPGHVFFGDRDEQWSVGTGSAFRKMEKGGGK